MTNQIKRRVALIAGLVLCAVILMSCSMVSVNTDKDRAQVVATVNGEEITKGEVMDLVDMQLTYYYGASREDFITQYGEESWQMVKDSTLDLLIDDVLMLQQAKKDGLYDDSDEAKAEIRAEIEQQISEYETMLAESAKMSGETENVDEYVQEQMDVFLTNTGYNDIDKAVQDTIENRAINAEREKQDSEVEYTDAQAQEYYDILLEEQEAAITADPANYASYSYGISVYRPEEARYVKNLLIGFSEDVQAQIQTLRQEGDDEGADALVEEELAKIKSQADEVLKRAKDGEDFDILVEEYGTDPGMQQEPNKTLGYVVYTGSNFVEPFETASMALSSVGAVSDLVPTDYGYHILLYAGDAGGAVPFDEVKEAIIAQNLSEAQSEYSDEQLEKWKEEADITTYPDRLATFAN